MGVLKKIICAQPNYNLLPCLNVPLGSYSPSEMNLRCKIAQWGKWKGFYDYTRVPSWNMPRPNNIGRCVLIHTNPQIKPASHVSMFPLGTTVRLKWIWDANFCSESGESMKVRGKKALLCLHKGKPAKLGNQSCTHFPLAILVPLLLTCLAFWIK